MELFVEGKGSIGLPPAKPFGAQILKPGKNPVPDAYWERVKDHPGVKAHMERGGKLRAEKEKRVEVTERPDAKTALTKLTVEKASPWIEQQTDPNVLLAWRRADDRKGIYTLIDARLAEIAPDPD